MTISMEKWRQCTSHIVLLLKLHHREHCQICWEIFKNHKVKKNLKIGQALSHFWTIYVWHRPIWNIIWWLACTIKKMYILGFLIFEFSLRRSLQNKLRDFQNSWIYKMWKFPILYANFWPYMVRYDKQQLSYDNQHGQMKKIYISDFLFWKLFHRDLC